MITLLAYMADIAILGTYWLMVRGKSVKWFHLANAIGCIPLIVTEVISGAYAVIVITAAFGIIGAIGFVNCLLTIPHREGRV
jgi:hypothetical protein